MKLRIAASTEVYEDSYNEGELNHVNWFESSTITKEKFSTITKEIGSNITEDELKNIILEYVDNHIYYTCKKEWLEYDENIEGFSFSVLVDDDNDEVHDNSDILAKWKEGKATLYASNISIQIDFLETVDYSEVVK